MGLECPLESIKSRKIKKVIAEKSGTSKSGSKSDLVVSSLAFVERQRGVSNAKWMGMSMSKTKVHKSDIQVAG